MAPKNDPNFDPPKINLKCSVRWNYVAVMNVACTLMSHCSKLLMLMSCAKMSRGHLLTSTVHNFFNFEGRIFLRPVLNFPL
jgi:hypothetical protein